MQTQSRRRSEEQPVPSNKGNMLQSTNILEDEDEIDLQALLMRLLDHWILISLVAILGAAIAGVYSFMLAVPHYEATSKLYVLNNKDSAVNLSDLQISSQLTNDYQEVFINWPVQEKVLQETGLDYSYEDLEKMVKISNPTNTRIIYITVNSTDPQEAKLLADTYANVAREFITAKMESQTPTVFGEALLPTKPVSPKKTLNIIIGFVLGFMLAAGIITLRFILDDYIRTPDDFTKATGLPVLGTVMNQDESKIRKDMAKKSRQRGGN